MQVHGREVLALTEAFQVKSYFAEGMCSMCAPVVFLQAIREGVAAVFAFSCLVVRPQGCVSAACINHSQNITAEPAEYNTGDQQRMQLHQQARGACISTDTSKLEIHFMHRRIPVVPMRQ